MYTINSEISLSFNLLKSSRIIQDMIEDCKGELPTNFDIPSLKGLVQQEDIDKLEKMDMRYEPWSESSTIQMLPSIETTLLAAIALDIRWHISTICCITKSLRDKYIIKEDIMSACIENCGNKSFNILRYLASHGPYKAYRKALARIEDFCKTDMSNEHLTEYIIHRDRNATPVYIFSTSKFVIRQIEIKNLKTNKIRDTNFAKLIDRLVSENGPSFEDIMLHKKLLQHLIQSPLYYLLDDVIYNTKKNTCWMSIDGGYDTNGDVSLLTDKCYIIDVSDEKFETISIDDTVHECHFARD